MQKKGKKPKKSKRTGGSDKSDESPAEKKARLVLQAGKAKEVAAKHKAATTHSQKIITKVAPAIQVIEAMLSKDSIELVAAPLIDPVKEALAELVKFRSLATGMLGAAAGEVDADDVPDMKTITTMIGETRKSCALVLNMLAGIAKHRTR